MARGYIYDIKNNPEDLGISESDFYEDADSLNADYVKNTDPSDAKRLVDEFAKRLEYYGFKVEPFTYEDDEGNERNGYVFHTGSVDALKQAQHKYFANRIKDLKSSVEELDEDKFCSDTGYATSLKAMIIDDYDDVVSGEYNCTESVDRWMRGLEPGKTLYLGADVVFMH